MNHSCTLLYHGIWDAPYKNVQEAAGKFPNCAILRNRIFDETQHALEEILYDGMSEIISDSIMDEVGLRLEGDE